MRLPIFILTKGFMLLNSMLMVLVLSCFGVTAQNLTGAWKLVSRDGKAFEGECIAIYSDGYFMFGAHNADGSFANAGGGKYKISGAEYTEVLDFHSSDTTQVRRPSKHSISVKKDELKISGNGITATWERIDKVSTPLSGAWRFGARVNDEGVAGERRGGASPRQTMKIMSGNYFQWAAFNYETKQFSGTGGGTYKLQDNQYTETIRFFSRDNSRVGITLTFECKLVGSDWYHKGKGTTGNPVNEVWEKVK